jgi:hypothetical protein
MDRTITAIEKLKEVELELHMLKNYAELMNRSVEAKKEWVGLTDEDRWELVQKTPSFDEAVAAVEAKLKEKNAA